MTKKINAIFLLLLSLAIFDKLVKGITEFSINLDVQYHGSWMLFVVFVIWLFYKEARNKLDKAVLITLSLPFILRIFLNLLAINKDYKTYTSLVSNEYIDRFTWMSLACLLILIAWRKYQE
jgi:hypothetical protein